MRRARFVDEGGALLILFVNLLNNATHNERLAPRKGPESQALARG